MQNSISLMSDLDSNYCSRVSIMLKVQGPVQESFQNFKHHNKQYHLFR